MRRCRILCFWLILMLPAVRAYAGDHLVTNVPLPDDVTVNPAPDGLAPDLKRFLGVWTGSWGGANRHILIVEAVRSDATADVVYAIAGSAPAHVPPIWYRTTATIAHDTLTLQRRESINYVLESSGTLFATYRYGSAAATARMKPASLEKLSTRTAELDWSEPVSTFVDGPPENGTPLKLEVVLFHPAGAGPFPLAIFNHGSTGNGRDPALFGVTTWDYVVADYLTSRGWLAAFPQRRGRGHSSGPYDEGFAPDRSQGYSCDPATSLRGADRALTDIEGAVTALRQRPDVVQSPVLMVGVSRGGILSLAFAGRHPDLIGGVVNFVGGWMGESCVNATEINDTLFREAARYPRPTLWLYGESDRFYSIAHSQRNFDTFRAAGGTGEFLTFTVPNGNGHGISAFRELWLGPADSYLRSIESATSH
jgi:dienelactone hydrolase